MKSACWYEHLYWNNFPSPLAWHLQIFHCEPLLLPYSAVTTPSKLFTPWKQELSCGLWEPHCSRFWCWINIMDTHEHTSIHFICLLGELFCPFLSWQKDLNEKSHKGTLLGKAAKQREFICFRYSPAPFTHYFFLTFTYFQSPDLSGSHV